MNVISGLANGFTFKFWGISNTVHKVFSSTPRIARSGQVKRGKSNKVNFRLKNRVRSKTIYYSNTAIFLIATTVYSIFLGDFLS